MMIQRKIPLRLCVPSRLRLCGEQWFIQSFLNLYISFIYIFQPLDSLIDVRVSITNNQIPCRLNLLIIFSIVRDVQEILQKNWKILIIFSIKCFVLLDRQSRTGNIKHLTQRKTTGETILPWFSGSAVYHSSWHNLFASDRFTNCFSSVVRNFCHHTHVCDYTWFDWHKQKHKDGIQWKINWTLRFTSVSLCLQAEEEEEVGYAEGTLESEWKDWFVCPPFTTPHLITRAVISSYSFICLHNPAATQCSISSETVPSL